MSRWKAAAIHLACSMIMALVLLSIVFFLLYPAPLFQAMGGSELAILVIAVDAVLGPLLTLMIFRSGKRGLKFDLGVIVTLQLVALVYGAAIIWMSRPVLIVARDDIAYVMAASDIHATDLAEAEHPEFSRLSWTGPVYARLRRPAPGPEQDAILDLNLKQGRDIQHLPKFFQPWVAGNADLLENAEPLENLRHRKPQYAANIDHWLKTHDRSIDSVSYILLVAFQRDQCLLVDTQTGLPVGILDADPS